jgi:hypothetical protein
MTSIAAPLRNRPIRNRPAANRHVARRLAAWLAGGALAVLPLVAAMGENGTKRSVPDISGIWQVAKYEKSIRTVDGQRPPLKPAAFEEYARNLRERQKLRPKQDMARCVPPGIPRIMWAPRPVMVLQTARKVTFVHEYQHVLRHIYLDEPAPDPADLDPTFLGESVGRWDGDTLVIETVGLNDQTVLDRAGLPHSKAMRVTERIRPIDGGKRLEDLVTIDDPETFTASWTARVVFQRAKPDVQLQEYHCTLVHEDL